METINLSTLAKHFSNEAAAWELVERMRWPNGPECPHCGTVGQAYFLKPRNGERTTRSGSVSYRRLWKCASCRKQFSVLVGTIFHRSHVPLSKWLLAIYMMCADKNGVAAYELHRTLGVTTRTAWHMLHRIREAMKEGPLSEMLTGTVVADETFIGGKEKNRHQQGKPRAYGPGGGGRFQRAAAMENKTAVLSLVDLGTGKVRSRIVADVTGATLRKAIAEQVDMGRTTLHTDGASSYRTFASEFAQHRSVDHLHREYVRREADGVVVTTNQAEGYFSQLKRSLDGTQHHVSREHLHRYLAEFDYRYSTRKMRDGKRMLDLMGRTAARPLTYRSLVAR